MSITLSALQVIVLFTLSDEKFLHLPCAYIPFSSTPGQDSQEHCMTLKIFVVQIEEWL